ncbi:MAG: hypothetical protein AAF641_15840 [Pseudomonadota bacterium]
MNTVRAQQFWATWPIVAFVCIFIALRVAFDYLGGSFASMMALAGAICAMIFVRWLKSRNTRAKARRAIALRQQLSALEQQETALRIKEARRAGKFDKWEAGS